MRCPDCNKFVSMEGLSEEQQKLVREQLLNPIPVKVGELMKTCTSGWGRSLSGFKIDGSIKWSEFWFEFGASATPEVVNGDLIWYVAMADRQLDSWVKFWPDHPDRLLELITAANRGANVKGIGE